MRKYTVAYKMYFEDEVHWIEVEAKTKEQAYEVATAIHGAISDKEGEPAYSVWVESVKYKNGTVKEFDTFEGKPL